MGRGREDKTERRDKSLKEKEKEECENKRKCENMLSKRVPCVCNLGDDLLMH